MNTPLRTIITCRYTGGTYLARNRDSGKTCSCTESERAAVQGLVRKLAPDATDPYIKQISGGVWVLDVPSTELGGGL